MHALRAQERDTEAPSTSFKHAARGAAGHGSRRWPPTHLAVSQPFSPDPTQGADLNSDKTSSKFAEVTTEKDQGITEARIIGRRISWGRKGLACLKARASCAEGRAVRGVKGPARSSDCTETKQLQQKTSEQYIHIYIYYL